MEDEKKINWLSLFIKIVIAFAFILIIVWLVSKLINRNKLSDTFKNNINNMETVAVKYFKEFSKEEIHNPRKQVRLFAVVFYKHYAQSGRQSKRNYA